MKDHSLHSVKFVFKNNNIYLRGETMIIFTEALPLLFMAVFRFLFLSLSAIYD